MLPFVMARSLGHLVIRLHERPGGRVVAIDSFELSVHEGDYAFGARPGTYSSTTSDVPWLPSRGDILIGATTKAVVEVTISTSC